MTDERVAGYRRKRRHFRGYRRFKVILLSLGLAGLLLGFGLIAACFGPGRGKLFDFGLVYIFVSMILLGLRGIVIYLKRIGSIEE